MDRGKTFPGESGNEGNYKSLGSLSQSNLTYKDKLEWLINNAIIPDDSPEMRDQKLAEIFSAQIKNAETTVNPLRVSDIKRAMTEDDIMIALQIAAWNATDGYIMHNLKGKFGNIESSLLGNNPFGENKGTFIKEMVSYYINGMNSGTPTPATGEDPAFLQAAVSAIDNGPYTYIGKYTLKNTTRDYTIDFSFYDENNNKLEDVKYTLFSTNTPTSLADVLSPTREDLNGKDFYIRLKRTTKARKVVVTLQPKITATTQATVWGPQDDSETKQKLLSIERTETVTPPITSELEFTPAPAEYKADLALRKHISQIIEYDKTIDEFLPPIVLDGTSNDRTPVASPSNGEYNEWNYSHRKDPYQLDLSNPNHEYYVLYAFNVYNEHEEQVIAPTQITDYLPPSGLEFVKKSLSDFEDIGEAMDNPIYFYNTSKYNWTYSSDTNSVVLNMEAANIQPVDAQGIHSCDTQYLMLKVTDEARGKILTNIAEVTGYQTPELNVLDHDSGFYDDEIRKKVVLPNEESDWENYKGYDNKSDLADKNYYYKGQEDDDDFEKIQVKGSLDIALRKNLTHVNGSQVNPSRIGEIETSDLMTGEGGTATYNDTKTNYPVSVGDLVTFKIRLYNEGQTDAYAKEVKDFIPKGLAFIPQYDLNITNGWSVDSSEQATAEPLRNWDKKSRVTNSSLQGATTENATVFLGPVTIKSAALDNNNKMLKPFNKSTQTLDDSVFLQLTCLVVDPFEVNEAIEQKVLTNVAVVSKYGDSNGNSPEEDYDSNSNNITTREQVNNFNESNHEDDEDYDKLIVSKQVNFYDLALKKYIVGIKSADGTTITIPDNQKRICTVESVQDLIDRDPDDPRADADYKLEKPTISINDGDYITYCIRVYNEGQQDAVVKMLVDSVPKGLELAGYQTDGNNQYVSGSQTNYTYNWVEFSDNVNGNTGWTEGVKSDYLNNERLKINAFDPSKANEEGKGLSYQEVFIEFKVNLSELNDSEKASIMSSGIVNTAEIYADDEGVNDVDSTPNNKVTTEDDIDQDRVYPGIYDLALKKAVTEIVGKTIPDNQKRVIRVTNTDRLRDRANNTKADATYSIDKSLPVSIQDGDHVVYTIRVYNEGRQDAKVLDIKDSIPPGLKVAGYEKDDNGEYKSGSRINYTYRWYYKDEGLNGNIYSEYLKDKTIPAFDNSQSTDAQGNKELGLSYEDVKIEFVVDLSNLSATEKNQLSRNGIENIAEIIRDDGSDNDSEPGNNDPAEDDQDSDKIIPKEFDLALRKFIYFLDQNYRDTVMDREPKVIYKNGQLSYEHNKEPLIVHKGNTIVYAIRVYNEGSQAGYAAEITDSLPNGLKFNVGDTTNEDYRWVGYDKDGKVTTDEDKIVTIKTDYLSKQNEKTPGENLLRPFDSSKPIVQGDVGEYSENNNPDYRDVLVSCRVDKDPTENPKVLTNIAEITEDTDEDGKPVDDVDTDDIKDEESVEMRYFDLSLLKYVTKVMVTEDGVTKEIETGYNGLENPEPIVKIELNGNKVNTTDVKYRYIIKVTNEGEIAGKALEITDRLPEGLAFVEADNTQWGWKVSQDGIIKTDYLKDTELKPGQSAEVPLILTWVKGSMGIKVNTAEISLDYNEYGAQDFDSIPNNNNEIEDDQDDAVVSIQVSTGSAPIYLTLIISVLSILGTGSYLIYRYVLKRD